MRILHHFPLSPYCRKVRLTLGEKRLPYEPLTERFWEQRPEFARINPAREVPVLVEDNGLTIPDSNVICEYLEEAYADPCLLGRTLAERVEVRRLEAWFDHKFARDVTSNILGEKVFKRLSGRGNPDGNALRVGYANIRPHLDYIGQLAEARTWLAGGFLSLADFAAAAHLSCLDFLGEIDWSKSPAARDWYARIKSRPCFRALLNDRVPGINPPSYYGNLDF